MTTHLSGITTISKETKYSKVWLEDDWVYKRQHEFLTNNEYWYLTQMWPSGFVPEVEQVARDLIRTRYIAHRKPYESDVYLMQYVPKILGSLAAAGIRHGDLTKYAVLIAFSGVPKIIDFAESRLWDDPRPDKRPEGDRYWLTKTMEELVNGTS